MIDWESGWTISVVGASGVFIILGILMALLKIFGIMLQRFLFKIKIGK
ncbi:MAG: hypothetical protein SV062_15290 [Thermodesulfobacteriota bacterium]|nr:hypothetical protein [Thermodesulfobacteriota bacterium]